MDPLSLTLAAAIGLGLFGITSEATANGEAAANVMLVRSLYTWDNGWLATELNSEASLKVAGEIFDLDMVAWWPAVKSGMTRVVVITQAGGPAELATIACFSRAGRYGWTLDSAYRMGYRKVHDDGAYQRIAELMNAVLNADPAMEVAEAAMQMTPVKRYHYLRQVLMANPYLSAALATSPLFKDLVVDTVSRPQVQRVTGRVPEALPSPTFAPSLAVQSPQLTAVPAR